jgi:preprotein translocase subunit SecA
MARDKKIIKNYGKVADQIIALDSYMAGLTDEELGAKTNEFKERLASGDDLDNLLVEAYATVREAAFRKLGLKAYRVQLIGGIILHYGDVAEMRTGEGKTLTGLFPAYLNALTGDGVHIVTVNEYLSQRDSEINGKVYSCLGITVGLNGRGLTKDQKRNAYAADVTYTTNAELGFDYLRDNMVFDLSQKVQRGLNYAIIDEADSVLIDEARTPLIISGGKQNRVNFYQAADTFAKTLAKESDVDFDLESKQVYLTDSGVEKAQKYFSIKSLFDVNNTELFHLIMNALKANFVFKNGVEYTVRDNEIVLIDQFTGRIMPGRAYSDGLQQALQAKEGVRIEEETQTVATITYQNFYRLYAKISGMTGTAKTEEEEFIKIYNTRVVVCPTNVPIIRVDEPDYTFATKQAALKKMVADIKIINEAGRPILIGTTSVESSEQVAHHLEKANLKFEMINAKNHAREAEIVEKAGQKSAITLATNMAGRGTDIKLSKEVKELGGLFVFGVERNEARRIDNQLRGRAGRQGDPGDSRFYISMEDDLMVRFTTPKLRQRFVKILGEDFMQSKMFHRAITGAQKKLEGLNFDQRKNVLDYDNVLAQQREAIYGQRDNILEQSDLKIVIERFQYTHAFELLLEHSDYVRGERALNTKELISAIDGKLVPEGSLTEAMFSGKEDKDIAKIIQKQMMNFYKFRIDDVPNDVVFGMEKRTILQAFDKFWTRHINLAQKLRSGIYLQQYAQNNPLSYYVEESAKLFNKMKVDIAAETVDLLSKVVIKKVSKEDVEAQQQAQQQAKPKEIKVTDKDIDSILAKWGIKKEEFTRKHVEKRVNELREEWKDDAEKIKRLNFDFAVINGLMTQLDKMMLQQKQMGLKISNDQFAEAAKNLGITNLETVTPELVQQKMSEIIADKDEDKTKAAIQNSQIVLAKLFSLAQEKVNGKKSKDQFVVDDGKTKKVVKRKDDGTINDEVFDDSEQINETKTKIG